MAEHQVSTLGMGVRSSPPASSDATDMLSVMKTDEQRRARELRAQGRSIGDIQHELGVSRSSVSTWVRDVELTAEQRTRLIARSRLGPIVAGPKKAAAAREVRRGHQEHGRQ